MERLKNKNGITLIALVITIIILLILAGITINLTLGKNGIIKMAEKAGKNYQDASIYEKNVLNNLYEEMTKENQTKDAPLTIRVGAETHEAKEIKYSWEQLHEIAKVISDNYGEEAGKINNNTAEVAVVVNEEPGVLGIGDWKTLNGKKVRILGFNHDKLVTKRKDEVGTEITISQYGKGTTNTYAGISFEFAESISTGKMNGSKTNSGGWGVCDLREALNTTTLDSLENKKQIKQVNKQYIATRDDAASVTTSQDKLWLLSFSEIWNSGVNGMSYGYARAKEGEQYKYYKNINPNPYNKNPNLVKNNNDIADKWWLRSSCGENPEDFGRVKDDRGLLSLWCLLYSFSFSWIFNISVLFK